MTSLILTRGGELLGLTKVRDRMTVAFRDATASLPDEIVALACQELPSYNPNIPRFEEVTVIAEDLDEVMALVRESDACAFVSHVYYLEQNPETPVYLTNELTIQWSDQVTLEEQANLAQSWGLEQRKPVIGIDNTYVYQLTSETTENPLKIANRLLNYDGVITAEVNIIVPQESLIIEPESSTNEAWDLELMETANAWEITRGNPEVIIATTTTESENLKPKLRVASDCTLTVLDIPGYIDDNIIEDLCQRACASNASILILNWTPNTVYFPLSLRQSLAIHRLTTESRDGKGCVVVMAAGNCDRPLDGTIFERNWQHNLLQGPTTWLNGFAIHPDVITVSASTSRNHKAVASNWGHHISVCAPSDQTPPVKLFATTGLVPTPPEITHSLSGKVSPQYSGTAHAAFLVGEVAALMLTINPQLTAQQIKEILQQTATKIRDEKPDPQLGLHLGTYENHGHCQWFGYGLVNAYQAVKLAQNYQTTTEQLHQIQATNETPETIPDNQPQGIASLINITESGRIQDVAININIEHEYLGDVEISLKTPNNQVILLQNRTLGDQTKLEKTYNLQNTPSLKRIVNQDSVGDWYLWIVDYAAEDTGKLISWQLTFWSI